MRELSLKVGTLDISTVVSEVSEDAVIALKPFSDRVGLEWSGQQKKVTKNPQFTCVHMYMHDTIGRKQEMLCIPVRQIGMWLCTINANKVKPEIRENLIQFQMYLQVVIHEALTGRVTPEVVRRLEEKLKEAFGIIAKQQAQIDMLLSDSAAMIVAADHMASSASHSMHAAKKTKHLRLVV